MGLLGAGSAAGLHGNGRGGAVAYVCRRRGIDGVVAVGRAVLAYGGGRGGYAVVGGVSELGRSSVVGGAVLFITPLVVEFDEGEVEGFEEDSDHAAYFEKECYHTFIRFSCFYLN